MSTDYGWYRCPTCNNPTAAVDDSGEQPPCALNCAPVAERDPSDPSEPESDPDPECDPESEPAAEPEPEPEPAASIDAADGETVSVPNPAVTLVAS